MTCVTVHMFEPTFGTIICDSRVCDHLSGLLGGKEIPTHSGDVKLKHMVERETQLKRQKDSNEA